MAYTNNDVNPSPFLWGRIDSGPTHGYVRRPLFAERLVTASTTLQFCDFQLLIKPNPVDNITIVLMSVRAWLDSPLGGTPFLVQDQMAVGTQGLSIAIVAAAGEKINGQSSWQIVSDYASVMIRPLIDYSGWSAQ
jgi:hypothetical protein